MTKTLTTKALRALRDSLKSWQDGYDPVDDKEQYEMFVTAETAVGELLANREAQPVAEVLSSRSGNDTSTIDKALPAGTKLYTAPPAPAVPGKITPSQAQALCPSKYYVMNGDELNVAADFWNACRAAMLAQPVTQGCNWIACGEQLPAVGETVLVSSDGYVSVGESERSGANYRYFTSVATGRELTVTHWMPLPAAPEGGN